MDQHLKNVILNLLEGTKRRNLKWHAGDRTTEYRLCLEHGIINVDVWGDADPFAGGAPEELADITFFNKDGDVVDRYCFSKKEERDSYNELVALHEAARRNHLKVEETLAGLFSEIEKMARGSSSG